MTLASSSRDATDTFGGSGSSVAALAPLSPTESLLNDAHDPGIGMKGERVEVNRLDDNRRVQSEAAALVPFEDLEAVGDEP